MKIMYYGFSLSRNIQYHKEDYALIPQQLMRKRIRFIRKTRILRHIYKMIAFLLAVIYLSMVALPVNIHAAEWTNEQQSQFDQATLNIMEQTYTPGCSVVFINEDETSYFNYGYSNLKNQQKVNDNTLFIIGSNSKAFTGLSILLAESDGLIDLDENISTYIPWFETYYNEEKTEITIRQLLSHSSGLPYNKMFYEITGEYDGILEDEIKALNSCELSFAPGTAFKYVNHNYILLAYVLQTVCGVKYEDYIEKNILEPLGMKDTYLYFNEAEQTGRLAKGYRQFFFGAQEYTAKWKGAAKGAGYYISSAADMTLWLQAQIGVLVVPERLRQAILKSHDPHQMSPGLQLHNEDAYFAGWNISKDGSSISHSGDVEGYGSDIQLLPAQKIAVGSLVNSAMGPAEYITTNFLLALEEKELKTNAGFGTHTMNQFSSWGIVICTFVLMLLLLKLAQLIKRSRRKFISFNKLKKVSISIPCIVLLALAGACLALPKLMGYPYRALINWMPSTVPIFLMEIVLTCLVGILCLMGVPKKTK